MGRTELASWPIFVLGIDRSGTSMLSEVLSRWGARGGRQELMPDADEGNPQGYWEYRPMQDLFGELINSVGTSIWDPEFSRRIAGRASDPEMRRRALELAEGMAPPGEAWFWKDAQLIFALPFLLEVFPNAIYLITLRNPYDSALSYEKLRIPPALRGKIRLVGYTLLRWQHLMLIIFENLKLYRGKLLVPYEELVASPRQQCARLCSFLDAACGLNGDGAGKVERMAQTINPRLWRNDSKVPFSEIAQASNSQKELYAYLSSHLDGEVEDFDSELYPLPEWSREYCANMSVMQWLFGNL